MRLIVRGKTDKNLCMGVVEARRDELRVFFPFADVLPDQAKYAFGAKEFTFFLPIRGQLFEQGGEENRYSDPAVWAGEDAVDMSAFDTACWALPGPGGPNIECRVALPVEGRLPCDRFDFEHD